MQSTRRRETPQAQMPPDQLMFNAQLQSESMEREGCVLLLSQIRVGLERNNRQPASNTKTSGNEKK
jgi:hypothetical protein